MWFLAHAVLKALQNGRNFAPRTCKLAHAFTLRTFVSACMLYVPQCTLADPVSVFTHSSELPWLVSFQGGPVVITLLLFAYCPNNNPKAVTLEWICIIAQSKNIKYSKWQNCSSENYIFLSSWLHLIFWNIHISFSKSKFLSKGVSQGISWGISQAMLSKVFTTSKFCE